MHNGDNYTTSKDAAKILENINIISKCVSYEASEQMMTILKATRKDRGKSRAGGAQVGTNS